MRVHAFGPAWDCIDLSPFCVKLQTWLKMAAQPFDVKVSSVLKAPKGKLPVLEWQGRRMGDSNLIIEHLQEELADPLGDRTRSVQRQALGRAVQSMLDNEFYFAAIHLRWLPEQNFAYLRPVLIRYLREVGVPGALAPLAARIIRRKFVSQTHAQGAGRHSLETSASTLTSILKHISELLGNQSFLLGNSASTADATLFAYLHVVLGSPFMMTGRECLLKTDNLVAYHQRMLERYWPERLHDGELSQAA